MRKLLTVVVLICISIFSNAQSISPAGPIDLCPGGSQVLTVTGAPVGTTFQWQLNGGDIPGATAISYTASATGNYRVILDGGGPGNTLTAVVVTLRPNPVAAFTFSPNNQCASTTVAFANTSSGTGLSYSWDFGDPNAGTANTSTAAQPTHRFVGNPGNGTQSFIVTLTVTSVYGCVANASQTVTVSQSPDLNLGGPGLTVYNNKKYFRKCSNAATAQFDFTNQSVASTNTFYRIVFGDASPDYAASTFAAPVSHNYPVGTFTLLYIVTGQNGCVDTATYYVFVGSNPAVGLGNPGNTAICNSNTLTFPVSSTATNPPGTIYTVTFNDGTPPSSFPHPAPANISHTFLLTSCGTTSPGYPNSFSATIQASNPCNSSTATVVPIYVSQKPVAAFSIAPNDTICVNSTATFTNTSGDANEIDNGTCIPGKFIWTVTPSTGWTVASGTLGNDFNLADPSTWLSGSTSLSLNFTATGTYSIKLKLGNLTCGADSITKTICVNPLPTGSFSVNQNTGCAPLTVNTTSSSNASLCGTNRYAWSVQYAPTTGCTPSVSNFIYLGGTNSASPQPQFQFINPGIYTIEMVIIGPANACSSAVVTQIITVKGKPVVTLGPLPASICINGSVSPSVSATCYPATNSYAWTLAGGNPSSSTSANPGPVSYPTAGSFNISVAVTNECGTTSDSEPLNVQNVTPSNAGPAQTRCGSSITMAANTPAIGIGTWSQVSGPFAVITSSTSPTTTITSLTPGTYVFTWTINNSGCTSSSNVTINISSGPTISNAGPAQDLCLATSATLNSNTPVTGTGQWTQVSGAPATITNPTQTNTTVTGLSVGVYVFRWTISFSNCSPSTDDVQITIRDNPSPAIAGNNQVTCSSVVTMSGNTPAIGTGLWSQVTGNPVVITNAASPTTTITGLTTGNYTFKWTVSNGSCPPSSSNVQVTVTATPTIAAAGANQSLCAATSTTLAGNTAATGTGTWTQVSGPAATITNVNQANTSVTGLTTGVYVFRWTISNGSCPVTTDDVDITVYDNVTPSNAGPTQTRCGTSVTMAANTPVTGTGSWTQLSGTAVIITNASSPNTTITGLTAGNYAFTWTITNGACSSSSNVNISISAGPTTAIAGVNQDLCLLNSTTLNGNTPVIGTGQWTQVSGPAATITNPTQPNTTVTGLAVGTYLFRWTISFSNCTPSSDDVQVQVFDNPTTAAAGPAQVICTPTATMAANTAAIGSGLWTQVSGNPAVITNPASPVTTITGLTVGTYTFKWTISNGTCPATNNDVQITVTDIPTTADAGTNQSLCAVNTTTLAGNTATSGTGAWTQVSGPAAVITNPALPNTTVTGMVPGIYVFRWTIGNGVCPSNSDDVQVIIYENVTPSNAGPAQVRCGTSVTMAANTPTIGTGAWSQVSGATTAISNPTSPVTTITGLTTGNYVFQWTITNGACSNSSNVNITISSGPTAATAGADQDLCLATSTSLNGNIPVTGTGQWTQVSGPAATITDPTLNNTTVTGLVVGTYVFRWTISFSNCTPTSEDVQVRIFDNPTNAAAGPDQNICIPTALMAANTATIGIGAWTQLSGPSTATITDPSLPVTTISGLTGGIYQFIWTISNGPCPASKDTVAITYSTIANNSISGSTSVCINTAPPVITGSTPTGSIGGYSYQWQQSTDGGASWNNIPGATNIDYSPGVLTVSTCYRRIVTTVQCTGPQGDVSNTLCITVNPDSKALFTANPTLLCAPVNVDTIITLTTFPLQNLQYNWYQNNTLIPGTVNGLPPSYVIATPGQTVVIKLVTTSPFGCKPDSMDITLNTRPAVTANFIKDTSSGCGPLPVTFTNTSSILNSSIEFYWDFGNGSTLFNVQQPPSPIIYQPSPLFRDTTYYITLKVFSGCDTTIKRDSVKIFANPKARFTANTIGCSPFRDTIINNSFGQDAFTTYYWDFGDGTADTTFTTGTMYHTYITGIVDTFPIRLIMANRCGSDTQYMNVVVSPSNIQSQVSINGSQLYGCAAHTVTFQNSSTGATFLNWDFGDGTPVEITPNSQSTISHTYFTAGVFNVSVKLENFCSDTTILKQVTVYAPPVAAFSLNDNFICEGDTVFTNNTSSNANSYEWLWGDNTSTTGFNASHIYNTPGVYSIRLVANKVNAFGIVCTDTSAPRQVTVVALIPAIVNINPGTNPCAPYTISVSAGGAAAASQVDWYFYDNSTPPGIFHVSGPTASYTYNNPGTDSVKLVVVNAAGCSDSTVSVFTVNKKPLVVFTPFNIKTCNTDTTISFNATINYSGTDPINYEWFINDVSVGNSNPFTYRFQAPSGVTAVNNFNVKVLATNSFGCGDTTSLGNVIIQTLAVQHIVVSPSLVQEQPNSTFTFTDTSQVLPNSTYLWYTGDRNGQTLPGREITYTYGDTGQYHVKLLVQDFETGCSQTDSVTVFVLHVPGYLYVPNAICPGCAKAELRQFLPLGKGLKDYYLVIYNTWGQKVFETRSLDANGVPNQPWNGNWSGGQDAQQGAFYWQIEAHYINGSEWKGMLNPKSKLLEKQGFLTIIR